MEPGTNLDAEVATHIDSGIRCCAAHYNLDHSLAPACILCSVCRRWIRPNDMQGECRPARLEEVKDNEDETG